MRTTISLDDAVARLAEQVCAKENRNFSNLCEVALAAYCGARVEDPAKAELYAAAEVLTMPVALTALKREAVRKMKRRKAA